MRVLAVVHECDSGPAMLAERFRQLGAEVAIALAAPDLPDRIDGYDVLVVMGASPSVNDAHIAPWFTRELRLLRHADATGVPILGVCFGAQALAVALGGSVTAAAEPEIGWFTVDTNEPGLVAAGPWFEWHVDAITPPPTATVIATTPVSVQAYTVGRHLAVQFHPEVTDWNVGEWRRQGAAVLSGLGIDGDAMVDRTRHELDAARTRAYELVDRFLAFAGLAPANAR